MHNIEGTILNQKMTYTNLLATELSNKNDNYHSSN